MDIRFSNLEKLGKLINYLEKTLPNKKRIKSYHYIKTKLNFVKYTWDELGSIKLLINKWCKDNK
jgi:predicted restriction endonuclease